FGDYWADLDGADNGGVHTNSGVQNHMFYLLSEGGSGVNDHGVEYLVEGIGYNQAKEIAWGAMMNYLNASDGYITARNAWILSAIDLYGSCSQQVISVGQAWQAVGVTQYTSFDLASMCGTYYLPITIDATYGIENSNLLFGSFYSDCSATVNAYTSVTLKSAYYIQLNPGFTALSNCTFTAWIDPCEVSDYDPDDVRYSNTNTEAQMESIWHNSVSIYPTPADDHINITFEVPVNSDISISIFDITGKEISQWIQNTSFEPGNHQLQVPVYDLSSGLYVCVVSVGDTKQSEKFIVQHH
ncbi:MAG: M4 family metallopeptidase, partial [Chitinophagales bacterium]